MNEIIRLYISPQRFLLSPLQKDTSPSLEIDRASGRIVETQGKFGAQDKVQDIYGIIGNIKLLSGNYLLVITGRRCVGKINGAEIWKITRTKLFPYANDSNLTHAQKVDEKHYLRMLEWVLAMDGFYFSYSYDLTHSLQRIYSMSSEEKAKPLWARCDSRFFWNKHLMSSFITAKLDAWILPITMGFVQIEPATINNVNFDFALISRRSTRRVGTRYHVRGIDSEGNVANAVETEQMVLCNNRATAYVQTRGSIPLFWKQKPNLKYKPRPELHGQPIETAAACRRHFEELLKFYNKVVVINLIDQKGSELALGEGFENAVRVLNNQHAKYIAFDFHHQCRNMRYDRLSVLVDQVTDDLEKQGFFYEEKDQVQITQTGIFRTNCIDNLDRTNVVQGVLDRYSLAQQFMKLGIFTNASQKVSDFPAFEELYRHMWGNNADVLSMQYSGTGALKADFTRTGKRSLQGTINDGMNSLTRYFLNNFVDGYRQDSLDLFLGNYVVDPQNPSPFMKKSTLAILAVSVTAFVLFIYSLTLPEDNLIHTLAVVVFWIAAVFITYKMLLRNGRKYVSNPQLFLRE